MGEDLLGKQDGICSYKSFLSFFFFFFFFAGAWQAAISHFNYEGRNQPTSSVMCTVQKNNSCLPA